MSTVGVVGLGAMGGAVAERIVGSGFATSVYDVDATAVDRLVAVGATAATIPSIAQCDIVVTSLPSDAIVRSVLLDGGLLTAMGSSVLIELSTILPTTMRELAAAARDVAVVDAPVSGGPMEARAGALTLLVGATDANLERAHPVLEVLGAIEHVGSVGDGKVVKLVNNLMTMGNIAVAAEAFELGVSLGLDPRRMFDVLNRSGGRSQHFTKRMPWVLDRDFEARFALALGEKDVRLGLELAHASGYVMPVAACVHQLYEMGIAKGLGREDVVSVIKLYEDWAGEHRT